MPQQCTAICPTCAKSFDWSGIGRPRIYCSRDCKDKRNNIDWSKVDASCATCTRPVELSPTGRYPKYCSHACSEDARSLRRRKPPLETVDGGFECTSCQRLLPLTEEYFARRWYRFSTRCKECVRLERRASKTRWQVEYYHDNVDVVRAKETERRKSEARRAAMAAWRKANRSHLRQSLREWLKDHPERKAQYWETRRSNPTYRLSARISGQIRCALTRKGGVVESKRGRRWESLLGYTAVELAAHLESRFTAGMTWENMGKWHIDHIRPVASFSFKTVDDPEFLECWALSNLQPLWAIDNIRKHAKLNWEYPSDRFSYCPPRLPEAGDQNEGDRTD